MKARLVNGRLQRLASSLAVILALATASAMAGTCDWNPEGGLTITFDGVELRNLRPTLHAAASVDGPATPCDLVLAPGDGETDIATDHGPARRDIRRWQALGGDLQLTVELTRWPGRPFVTIAVEVANTGQTARHLFDLGIAHGDLVVEGDPSAWSASTFDSFDHARGGFQPAGPLVAGAASRSFLDLLALSSRGGARALVAAAVGPPSSDVRFLVTDRRLEMVADMGGIRLDPGERRRTDDILLHEGSYAAGIDAQVAWIARTHGHRPARPLVGWCSWYDLHDRINAAHVLATVDAIAADRQHLPIEVFQIDDGWQRAYGDWQADPVKFPDGLAPIARRIQSIGALPGIWVAPIRSSAHGFSATNQSPDHYLDPTDPQVQAFIKATLQARRDEGFRYFKLDFNYIRMKRLHDPKQTRLEAERTLFRLYRETLGEDVYLMACVGGPNRGCVGFADAARIGTDSLPNWGALWSGCVILDCINAVGTSAPVHARWYAVDPDVTYLRPRGLTEAEWRTWHGFVGLSGGLALVSEPFADPSFGAPETRAHFEILAPPVPAAVARMRSAGGGCDPWHSRIVLAPSDEYRATRPDAPTVVQLFNPDGNQPRTHDLAGLDLPPVPTYVTSFWDGPAYLGVATDPAHWISPPIARHDALLLRLTPVPADARPRVIGDTLRISQGFADLRDERWDAATGQLTIELVPTAGRRSGGRLLIAQTTRGTEPPPPLAVEAVEGCVAEATAQAASAHALGPGLHTSLTAIVLRDRQTTVPNRIVLKTGPVR